ncbi:8-amino-7-oxononanoate synthase [Calycomorphotria hydatis]|uniref:8-amino-7-oxononanoate synthase n=1 Tax=Calycomorphotria hydatis TaxID=2528027 RepID=UPI001E3300F4|nr:8-amino-7-oxononanoate synthase [Calycomorphotria hydatis]
MSDRAEIGDSMTMPGSMDWLAAELDQLSNNRLFRSRRNCRPLNGREIELDGQHLLNFGANDYLGLAHDQRVKEAAFEAIKQFGAGATASALICGRTEIHAELEQKLSEFEGSEQAILFPTGYAANLGVISTMAGPDDVIFCERENHSCLVDGCRLSGARFRVFRRHELSRLADDLKQQSGRRKWIVTDAVFSMDGDFAPLVELCDLADEHQAAVIVDEAHGTGVLGEQGRGLCEHLGVQDRVAVRIGTLSKAVGVSGGFVTGDNTLCDYLWNHTRTQMFSTAAPPASCAAAVAALKIMSEEPERREHVQQLSMALRDRLQKQSIQTLGEEIVPIVPVVISDIDQLLQVSEELQSAGFFVPAIRPPTVPKGTSRLRISLSAAHTENDIIGLADAITNVMRKVGAR